MKGAKEFADRSERLPIRLGVPPDAKLTEASVEVIQQGPRKVLVECGVGPLHERHVEFLCHFHHRGWDVAHESECGRVLAPGHGVESQQVQSEVLSKTEVG